MNRAIVIRASIIFGVLILAILIPLGLEAFTKNENIPSLSNPDDVYLTVDGVEITNGELWNTMKSVDGLEYLVDFTLEYLLADEIAALTQDEIDAEIKLQKYQTDDEEIIAQIMEDEEVHQDYLDAFDQNLIVMGYDPDDQASLKDYVALSFVRSADCIREVKYLLHKLRKNTPIISSARMINSSQPKYIYEKLSNKYDLKNKKVGVYGLAFKPNVDDFRESPSFDFISELINNNIDYISYDPYADKKIENNQVMSLIEFESYVDIIIVYVRHEQVNKINKKSIIINI
jgi:predicted CoA-binding protein